MTCIPFPASPRVCETGTRTLPQKDHQYQYCKKRWENADFLKSDICCTSNRRIRGLDRSSGHPRSTFDEQDNKSSLEFWVQRTWEKGDGREDACLGFAYSRKVVGKSSVCDPSASEVHMVGFWVGKNLWEIVLFCSSDDPVVPISYSSCLEPADITSCECFTDGKRDPLLSRECLERMILASSLLCGRLDPYL